MTDPTYEAESHHTPESRDRDARFVGHEVNADLVKRLRSLSDCDARAGEPLGKCMREAANRIEALEAEAEGSADIIAAERAEVLKLRAENRQAIERAEQAEDTLAAWFDRRKLAHEAIDQAVVDAASCYLRVSRIGGMPQDESDLVLGVIRDMAFRSVFADLFARAALAQKQGE